MLLVSLALAAFLPSQLHSRFSMTLIRIKVLKLSYKSSLTVEGALGGSHAIGTLKFKVTMYHFFFSCFDSLEADFPGVGGDLTSP